MSNVCCKEFKGWCKSFTKTEIFLCVLQTIFFIVFIALLIFLILHLVVCSKDKDNFEYPDHESEVNTTDGYTFRDNVATVERDKIFESTTNEDITTKKYIFFETSTDPQFFNQSVKEIIEDNTVTITEKNTSTVKVKKVTEDTAPVKEDTVGENTVSNKDHIVKEDGATAKEQNNVTVKDENTVTVDDKTVEENTLSVPVGTLEKGITCSWHPSKKTEAFIHYYEHGVTSKVTIVQRKKTVSPSLQLMPLFDVEEESHLEDNKLLEAAPDGELADDTQKGYLLALVKIKPSQDLTFGCVLTIVSQYWTLTAASCIEAIEEVDSLDSFVMMQDLGEKSHDNIHPVVDVMIHPQYQGVNVTYDLAALKSDDNLVTSGNLIVMLPTALDYFLITIGERLTVLGYGSFRNTEKLPQARVVRQVWAHSVPAGRCARESWAPRHLAGGRPLRRGRCGTAAVCAAVSVGVGAEAGVGVPCGYCAGTPLLRRRLLVGVMADERLCGVACEPALYVNLALVRDWLDTVFDYN